MSPGAAKKNLKFYSKEFIPFAVPSLGDDDIQAVTDCLRSGWLATGPKVQEFEQKLAEYVGAPFAVSVNSATSGLHLALLACGVGPGDEVLTTPFTFVATANVILHVGATPVFIDIEEGSYNIDVSQIEQAITPKTKAIMPVHFTGLPVDLDPLYDLAKKYSLRVIEDAAHAIGATYKNRQIGSFGDIQVFSFHPCKNMTTGEGGAITTSDEDVAKKLRTLRFFGIDRDAWNRYGKSGSQHIDVVLPGYKCNMSDIQASLGLSQLKKLGAMNARRKHLVNRYFEHLAGWEELIVPSFPNYEHENSWHIFAPRLHPEKAPLSRDDFMAEMKELNIGTGLHYPALHLYSYYRETYGYKPGDFPNVEATANSIVSLPLFSHMTEMQQDYVINAMREIFNKNAR